MRSPNVFVTSSLQPEHILDVVHGSHRGRRCAESRASSAWHRGRQSVGPGADCEAHRRHRCAGKVGGRVVGAHGMASFSSSLTFGEHYTQQAVVVLIESVAIAHNLAR